MKFNTRTLFPMFIVFLSILVAEYFSVPQPESAGEAPTNPQKPKPQEKKNWIAEHVLNLGSVGRRVRFSPNGRWVITTCDNGDGQIWNADSGKLHASLVGHRSFLWTIDISRDSTLLVTAGYDGIIRVWSIDTGQLRMELRGHKGPIWTVKLSNDTGFLFSGGEDGTLRLWDLASGVQTFSAQLGAPLREVCTVGYRYVAVRLSGLSPIFIYSYKSVEHLRSLSTHTPISAFSTSREMSTIYTGSTEGFVTVWDILNGIQVSRFQVGKGPIRLLRSFDNGRSLLVVSGENACEVWSTIGRLNHALLGHTRRVLSAQISTDERLILTGGVDKSAIIWDSRTGNRIEKLLGNTGYIYDAAFSANGDRAAAIDSDGRVIIWRLCTPKGTDSIGF